MKAGWGAALFLAVALSSCGLETVEYLAPPGTSPSSIPTDFSLQGDYTQLLLDHDSATYSGTHFEGYEIYYKIYASGVNTSSNLAQDKGRLDTSPTRDRLVSLGYQRLNGAPDHSTPEPLIALGSAGGAVVVLKFADFFKSLSAAVVEPTVTVGGTVAATTYRTVTTSGGAVVYPSFSDLMAPGTLTRQSDMDTNPITSSTFEIDVFLVAYSFTPEKTIYSQPVPWGILKPTP